jgi:hypothetical protein
MDDACEKLDKLLVTPRKRLGHLSNWTTGTIDRCLDIMFDTNEHWFRGTKDYRNHVPAAKY